MGVGTHPRRIRTTSRQPLPRRLLRPPLLQEPPELQVPPELQRVLVPLLLAERPVPPKTQWPKQPMPALAPSAV